jgi:hypothetical protein
MYFQEGSRPYRTAKENMKMKIASFVSLVLVAVTYLCPIKTIAQEVDLVGNVGWDLYRKKLITLYADLIENKRDTTTGALRLQVWATDQLYSEGTLTGYPMGTLPLNPLRVGYYYEDIFYAVRFNVPPPGIYYTTLALEEYRGGGFNVVDFVSFHEPVNFGGYGYGETSVGPDGPLCIAGQLKWEAANRRVRCRLGRIQNSTLNRTGALRLELWSLPNPFDGQNADGGLILCRRSLPRLKPGSEFTNLDFTTRFRMPVPGPYHTVLVLRERQGPFWNVVSYVNFPDISIF